MVGLALVLAAALGPAALPARVIGGADGDSALAASASASPQPAWISSYYDDLLAWLTYKARVRMGALTTARGKFDTGVNVASMITALPPGADVASLPKDSAYLVDVIDVSELEAARSRLPELVELREKFHNDALERQFYQALVAEGIVRPGVVRLLLVRARSTGKVINSRSVPDQTTQGQKNATHSEYQIQAVLSALGIPWNRSASTRSRLFSDQSPCGQCGPDLPANTRVLAAVDNRDSAKASKLADRLGVAEQVDRTHGDSAVLQTEFNPPCGPASPGKASIGSPSGVVLMAAAMPCGPASETSGALARELLKPDTAPGGVDFSSLELRYLADAGASQQGGIGYAFEAPASTAPPDRSAGVRAAVAASDAFFVWLEVQPSKFWVNLNPTEPDRIIDPDLGRTDAGRAMLQADLAMKKTVAGLIHPDTALGAQFWAQLTAGSDDQTCLSMRQWIVPAPATVREVGSELYILDAPLSVKMETDYLRGAGAAQPGAASCPPQDRAIEQHNEAVFRTLILPRVEQAVNTAPEYADLRRVYLSRVAAEWYRKRSAAHRTAYGDLVDRGNVAPWVSKQPWSPKDVFDQYVRSYTDGEFNVTHESRQGNVITTHTYVFGGVDFTSILERKLSAADFDREFPGLASNVHRASAAPVADAGGKGVWLAGTTASPRSSGSGSGLAGTLLVIPVLLWLAGALAALGVVAWVFTHRRA
jgi:hypothetical protein